MGSSDKVFQAQLDYEALLRSTEMVRALIKADADVNALDKNGRTPLYLAVNKGYADVVNILLGAGGHGLLRGNLHPPLAK